MKSDDFKPIPLDTVISICQKLGTIKSGMSYEITYADGRTETQPHTPALQAFLERKALDSTEG